MDAITALAGIIVVAMITPGPNNFIVMGAASRMGFRASVPAMAGIISGSTTLLIGVWSGAATVFEIVPDLRRVLMVAGAAYLVWLGGSLMWAALRSARSGVQASDSPFPASFAGVFAFQFFNPKAWVLVLTSTATIASAYSGSTALGILVALYVCIPLVCLSLWAVGGVALSLWLESGPVRRAFDFCMGLLLAGSALFLLY